MATASWQRLVMSMALCGLASTSSQAQSIELIRTNLFIGQQLDLELRVRFDGSLPHQALNPECFQIQIHYGEEEQAPEDIHLSMRHIRSEEIDTLVKLHLRGLIPIDEPWIQARLSLRCGAMLTREFTLLANPAPASASTRPEHAVRRRVALTSQRTSPQPSPRIPTPKNDTASTERDLLYLQRGQQHLIRQVAALEARLERQSYSHEHTTPPPTTANDEPPQQQAAMLTATPAPRQTSGKTGWWPWWTVLIGSGLAFLWGRHRSQPFHQLRHHEPLMPENLRPAATSPAMSPITTLPSSAGPPTTATSSTTPTTFPWLTESGEPSLDEPQLDVPLSTLDHAAEEGYIGATLAVLETTLQVRRSKSADILLRLLDGYAALQQPMNRARVASQLEALYNVDTTAIYPTLDETTHPIRANLISAWQQADRTSALAHLLLEKDGSVPTLDLAAFRDILWLHHLSLEDKEPSLSLAVLH